VKNQKRNRSSYGHEKRVPPHMVSKGTVTETQADHKKRVMGKTCAGVFIGRGRGTKASKISTYVTEGTNG